MPLDRKMDQSRGESPNTHTRFEDLFSTHHQELRRFFGRHLANRFDVEDCIQDTYLSLWRQEAKGHLRENARGYLFITALNVVRARWRKDRLRRQFPHTDISELCGLPHGVESERALSEREAVRLIGRQLGRLRPRIRDVFLKHHVEGFGIGEIAEQLGISTRTVERHMAKALTHCRATLSDLAADIL